ncbi:MAG: type II toxin-antitoxin system HicA family toxin [Candidatus Omnitrophota bacterium]
MKRKEFIRGLIKDRCILLRSGARHDIYINISTGKKQPVPRHTELDNRLARHIRKYLGLE